MKGKALRPAVSIGIAYAKPTAVLIGLMYKDIESELRRAFITCAMDDGKEDKKKKSITDEVMYILAFLLLKWQKRFDYTADISTALMIAQTLNNSNVTLRASLKELPINTDFTDADLEEAMKASTAEALELIKTIPQQAIAEVQGQVMRSIINGKGIPDIVSFIEKKYKTTIKRTKNRATDQARKAYQAFNLIRLNAIGVTQFEWVYTNRSKEPRLLHVHMNKHVYDIHNPPYIGEMYGAPVHGYPGQLPNCKCIMKPVINFNDKEQK